jgi:hypothetical protein
MIYLFTSSSNDIAFIPSASFADGDTLRLVFTNRFSEVTSSVSLSFAEYGKWRKTTITLPTDVDLKGGSYDLVFQKIISPGDSQIWGTSEEVWGTSNVVWNLGLVPQSYETDTTTTAFVSESISRFKYTSANENGAYVVYNG